MSSSASDPSTKRFRIAFSFAGEKRDFVKAVADLLAKRLGESAILYDKYHEAEFARNGLSIYLPELYNKQSDLVVVVVCPNYDEKAWTGLEWLAIHDLLQQKRRDVVMLSRFDHAQVQGLYGGAGFIELDTKTPEQFVTLILERLALNEGKSKDHYTKPVSASALILKTSIPHNLPTLQPFFGREDELKKIADALDPDSRTWGALIDGPGGMGKTSLAVRAAYDASPDVFEKIIFISLKTRELDDDGERDLSGFILSGLVELLNELAHELGCPNIAKAPEDRRPRLLHDALRRTQTLLVLDNLESLIKKERDTLFTFLNRLPVGCKAILTSRRRIGGGGVEIILEKLSEEAALATLAQLATNNPLLAQSSKDELLGLYRETSGNPLLLRWVAGQVGREHCLSLTHAIEFLKSCPGNNAPLDFIFSNLVDGFDAEDEKIVSVLVLFSKSAKLKFIALAAGIDEDESETRLRSLANRSLVLPSEDGGSFAIHPLAGKYLNLRRPEILHHSTRDLRNCAMAIMEEKCSRVVQAALLEDNWPIIEAALPVIIRASSREESRDFIEGIRLFLQESGRSDIYKWCVEQKNVTAAIAGPWHAQWGSGFDSI